MNRFDERSYGGQLFRPKPEVHIEEDGSLGIIATPWGPRAGARRAIDIMKDFILSARQDMEATSPFQKLTVLSPLANSLRVGVMLANDSLYREENRSEYVSGVELLVFSHFEGEMAFAQVGHPNLYLARAGQPWVPLSTQIDLAAEFAPAGSNLAPLPQNLVGMHTTTNLNVSSFKIQPDDKLIFLSHTHAAHALFSTSFNDTGLDRVSESLAKEYPDLPFWLGVYSWTPPQG